MRKDLAQRIDDALKQHVHNWQFAHFAYSTSSPDPFESVWACQCGAWKKELLKRE